MSSTLSAQSEQRRPDWFWRFLGQDGPWHGRRGIGGQHFIIRDGIPRAETLLSDAQAQTEETFAYKWKKRNTFESPPSLARMRAWLYERYGDPARADWLQQLGESPLMLDAGCGAGMSSLELFGGVLPRLRFLGIDVSSAVDVAARRFAERGLENAAFMQADISNLPLPSASVDIIFSEGVLHHTDSTQYAITQLSRLLRSGGRFLFYVYRKKGPVREFTDDYIRDRLKVMPPQAAWEAMEPLTRLGIALGGLNAQVEVPEAIDLLGIPAGRIDVQRLFYWHVAKAYYHPNLTLDEMNHINYDWYGPANAARQTPEEVRGWCEEAGLAVEREVIEDAGITVIARKRN